MTGQHVVNERNRGEAKLHQLEAYAGRLERIIEETAQALSARRHAAQGDDPLAVLILDQMRRARP